jgi:hypothetical protein
MSLRSRSARIPVENKVAFYQTFLGKLVRDAGLDEWPYLHAYYFGRIDGTKKETLYLARGYKVTRGVGETRVGRLRQALRERGEL